MRLLHPARFLLTVIALPAALIVAVPALPEAARAEALAEPPAAGDAADPARLEAAREVVARLHEIILDCMREADELGFQGRYEKMDRVVGETFDLAFMARASIGGQWRELDPTARKQWLELSRRLSATNYAHSFDSYDGERFEMVSQQPGERDTVWVRTRLVTRKDPDLHFDYRLREREGNWRIVDIALEGTVSELAMRRADYTSTIARTGFDQLVADLDRKIAEMSGDR